MARTSSKSNRAAWWLWLGVAVIVILCDQLTKIMIVRTFSLGQWSRVTSFFNLGLVYNQGAAFSFLASAGGWQRWFFILLGLAAALLICFFLRRYATQHLFCMSLSLILGGALGNVIDRIWHGYVVDFLDFHWRFLEPLFYGGHFPAFNLADSAITVGAILLVLDELRHVRNAR